jgi:hypothetical protein
MGTSFATFHVCTSSILLNFARGRTIGSVQTNVQPHMIAIHFVPAAVIHFALIQFFTDKIYYLTWCLPAP